MNDSTDTPKRNHVGRVLVAVLFFQLGLAGLLFWDDIADGLRMPGLSPRAPALDDPIRPGDQTRRFQPDRARPGGIPMPASPLPDRLTLTVVEAGTRVLLEGTIQAGDAERIEKQLSALEPMPEGVFLTGGVRARCVGAGAGAAANGDDDRITQRRYLLFRLPLSSGRRHQSNDPRRCLRRRASTLLR